MKAFLLAILLAVAPAWKITGYSPSDPGVDGTTASGVVANGGVTAACPPAISFGTRIWIERLGWRTCQDRGGAIRGRTIDVFVSTPERAYAITGKRKVLVFGERGSRP